MEDNLQRFFSILISVLIFFILPLYITFEKIDDISYSLALKITSSFVDEVTAKGYISEEMYNNFVSRLSVTGNTYDIKMEHVSKKYEPAYYVYDDDGKLLATLDYALYANMLKETTTKYVTISGNNYKKENIKLSYNTSEIKYTQDQILKVFDETDTVAYSKMELSEYRNIDKSSISLIPYMYANYKENESGNVEIDNSNRIYTMNKGDEFSVRIKNENVTIATVIFNAFTLGIGGTENNTRIYINYGGTIMEEEYKNLDVTK
ncbi:putative uncharacterized protein [Clostridium sp. CAG:465]|nr:putative uncharacterized protein [Clostridium sp. CAG:465]